MRKRVVKGDIFQVTKMKSGNGQIVAGRAGDEVWLANLELPQDAILDYQAGILTLTLPLRDGEYLAILDEPGLVRKRGLK